MMLVGVLGVVMKNHVPLVRRWSGLLRMPGDVAFLCGFRLNGCWPWWSGSVCVYEALRGSRLLLKSYVRAPKPIITGALSIRLPYVSIWLYIHLVAIESVGNGSSITGMSDRKSTLRIPWRNWRWTTDCIAHGVCFALNVEAVFVCCRGVDLIDLLLLSIRIGWVEKVRHICETR